MKMNNTKQEKQKGLSRLFTMEMPHTYLLIFAILVICALLTYVIPAGQFDTAPNDTGREILIRHLPPGGPEPRLSVSVF